MLRRLAHEAVLALEGADLKPSKVLLVNWIKLVIVSAHKTAFCLEREERDADWLLERVQRLVEVTRGACQRQRAFVECGALVRELRVLSAYD